MAYEKYGVADNAVGNIDAGILASTTTINLGTGEGALFPVGQQFVGTLVQYVTPADPTSGVVKSEKVLVTNRTGDTMTITRGYDGSTATTFNANDFFYLNVTSIVIEDIQNEVTRLETDKLNKGELRTGLANIWKMFFSNGSNAETELTFGNSGSYLKSTGTSSAPIWDNPPLDINGQTTSIAPTTTWYVALYSGAANFKVTLANLVKGLATSTTSQAGVIEMATDPEFITGTDESRCINSKQIKDNYGPGLSISSVSGTGISSSLQSNGLSLANLIYNLSSGGGSSASISLQTSPDNSTWTTKFTLSIGEVTNDKNSIAMLIPNTYYVRFVATGTFTYTATGTLYIQKT